MKLATFKTAQGTSYGIVTGKGIVDLKRYIGNRFADLKALIGGNAFAEAAKHAGEVPDYKESDITWLPVIPNPDKIVCVGLNYQDHVVETGRDNTEQPAIFLRVRESQVGHKQPIIRPRESKNLDYEAEIAVIIGKPGRRISQKDAWDHIAGYSCYNEGSVRDWQRHTVQWTAGKNFAHTGAFGPWMVTADEIPPNTKLTLSCRLNGERMQHATTEQMIFKIPKIIEYVSSWTTLLPGDVLANGTVAKAPPDGLTMVLLTGGHPGTAAVMKSLPYDPVKGFGMVSVVIEYPMTISVKPDSPIQSFPDLIARAKAEPGRISYSSAGPGSLHHLLGEWLNIEAGTTMLHVPFKGAAPAFTELLCGRIDVLIETATFAFPMIKANRLRPLALSSAGRYPLMPDVPPVGETLKAVEFSSWLRLAVAAGPTPPGLDLLNPESRAR